MLRQRQSYHELGSNFFDQRDKTGLQRRLVQRLEKLGYTVELHSAA
jgi:transposase